MEWGGGGDGVTTIATLFSGGELVGVGARQAGIDHLWGIEIDLDIAQVACDNGFDVITANAIWLDPTWFQCPDILHASPPCPNFSPAKTDGEETAEDVALAQTVVRFLDALTPRVFTLENVSMYRFSESWRLIQNALDRLGYWMSIENHLNMADYGVPQTRKRMIVRAIRGGWLPPLPAPVPWNGWYQAIEDLIPDLPDSEFAPWQLARMPKELLNSLLVDSAGYPDDDGVRVPVMREPHEPANTIVANFAKRPMRAFIMPGGGNTNFNEAHPGKGCRYEDEPSHTVTCQDGGGTYPKAFLATGQYAQPNTVPDRRCQTKNADEPSPTVTASTKGDWRAFIVDSCNARQTTPTVRASGDPMFTVVANAGDKGMPRASIPGRTVQMRPRCLARFQSIPDDYALPDNATLAVRIVGNAVPPLFYRRLIEPLA